MADFQSIADSHDLAAYVRKRAAGRPEHDYLARATLLLLDRMEGREPTHSVGDGIGSLVAQCLPASAIEHVETAVQTIASCSVGPDLPLRIWVRTSGGALIELVVAARSVTTGGQR